MKPQSKIILRYILRESMGVIMTGVALFWAAGTLAWWPGWAVLIIMTGWIVGTAVVILRLHPDLLAERLGPRKGAKRWDTAILSLIGLLQLARYIVAGLDFRTGARPAGCHGRPLPFCAPSGIFRDDPVRIVHRAGAELVAGAGCRGGDGGVVCAAHRPGGRRPAEGTARLRRLRREDPSPFAARRVVIFCSLL